MNAVYYGIRMFQCYMNPLPYDQWREMSFSAKTRNYPNLLGAKYYLCSNCAAVPPGYQLAREIEGYKLYATDKVRPRYYWSVEKADDSGSDQSFIDKVQTSDDYLTKVYLQPWEAKRFSDWRGVLPPNPRIEVLNEVRSLNSLRLRVQTNARGIFVLNEYFNKDWQLKLNGKRLSYFRANHNQMGFLMPEGVSDISFEFYPKIFVRLLYLQRVCLFVLITWASAFAFRNRSLFREWCRHEVAL